MSSNSGSASAGGEVDVRLDLSRHCVETAVRRAYNRAISEYFKPGGATAEREGRIDLLESALSGLDLGGLRGRDPALAGGFDGEVVLGRDPAGRLTLRVDGRPVALD